MLSCQATVQTDGSFRLPRNLVATLEQQEVERVGHGIAKARGMTFQPAKAGEYVRGTLAGSTNLVSGRYAMIDDGLGFSLVPWQPVLDQRIGRHIAGVMRGDGGIEWNFGRKLGLGSRGDGDCRSPPVRRLLGSSCGCLAVSRMPGNELHRGTCRRSMFRGLERPR